LDITNATIATSKPVIARVRSSVPAGSPSRCASTSAWRTMAMAAAKMTPQMTASRMTNNPDWSSAVAIQFLPSNASVKVTTASASGHSRHHGSRVSCFTQKVLP
jgi:hypothetical protein